MELTRFRHGDLPEALDALAAEVVDVVGEVRRELGAGLVEGVYVEAVCDELTSRGIPFEVEPPLPIWYKGKTLRKRYYPDLVIGGAIVFEAKAVEELHPVHFAQLLTYLRLSGKPLGFLVNFHAVPLSRGIHRRVNTRA